jgi:site-specific DNA-methyltransferase (adenine-specific)
MEKLRIIYKKVEDLIPYVNNPRNNDSAVDVVANSINEFGFKVPIIIDKSNIIIAGHTRLKAAQKLGIEEVPVIIADDLTPAQIKAFRIMDNKSSEYAEWDYDALKIELESLKELNFDLDLTGFGESEKDKGKYYLVEGDENEIFCSCPAGKNKLKCKHVKTLLGEINGSI